MGSGFKKKKNRKRFNREWCYNFDQTFPFVLDIFYEKKWKRFINGDKVFGY